MADLKILIPQNGITLDDDKFITLTGDSGTTGIDISLVENTPGGSFESLTGFPLTNQSLPTSGRGGPNKTSIDIPIEFPSISDSVKKTYLLTVTGTGNAMMGPYAATHGELSSNSPNNSATMNFVQYKDPTIKIVGIKDGRVEFTTDKGPTVVTQVGKALTSVDSLSWRSDSKGNTSVDFTLESYHTTGGGSTFTVIKQPIGWDSNDDNDNKDSDFTQDSTDHGNVVEIHSLVAESHTNNDYGKITGTIEFTTYGTKDVTFTIDMTDIFTITLP